MASHHRVRLSAAEARRVAIAAQGLDRPRPAAVDLRHYRSLSQRLDLIQLDTINIVARAHQFPAFSRLGPHDQGLLDRLAYERRELTETWAHEASLVRTETWPRYLWRMHERRDLGGWRRNDGYATKNAGFLDEVRDQLRDGGPLTPADLVAGHGGSGTWWGWSPAKDALEWLFATAEVGIARRDGNNGRFYDLIERVVPAEVLTAPIPSPAGAARAEFRAAATALGVGTVRDLADYHRQHVPTVRAFVPELVEAGELIEVAVEGWSEPAYLAPDARVPRRVDAAALVSPFDPIVWCRPRSERLFDFHYRIEIYTPKPKRIYGYYVYPFVHGDRPAARVDLKADRKAGVLRALGTFAEPHADVAAVAPALAHELTEVARWVGLDRVEVTDNGDLAPAVRRVLA